MTQERVLIVSTHPLFRDGIIRLLGDQADVVGAVTNWQEAQELPAERRPQVIIVDHDSPELKEADLAPLLWPDASDLRVIYVTLAGDKMVVHERHQVAGAGEADLLRALRGERQEIPPNDQSSRPPQDPQGRMTRMEKPSQRRNYTRHFIIVSVLVVITTAISLVILSRIPWMLPPATAQAGPVDALLSLHLIAIAFLFSLVMVFMLYSLFVFRRQGDDDGDGDHFEGNTKLEITWTIIPLVTVLIFSYLGAVGLRQVTAAQPNEMVVEATAFSFGWQFSYPELGLQNSPKLNLPVNQPIHLKMQSRDTDVIHNFWVPEFRVKQDLVPGVPTELRITPTRTGNFLVRCDELCGTGHTYMLAEVNVLDQAGFDVWVEEQKAVLSPEQMAQRGEELVNASGCIACHNITGDPGGIGPTWKGMYNHEVQLADGSTVVSDEEYLKRSIIDPNAQIVAGYNPGLMPANYADLFSEEQLQYMIEYFKTLE